MSEEHSKYDIEELEKKSKSTDRLLLIRAKEDAKRRVRDDPTAANIKALRDITALMERFSNENAEKIEIKYKSHKEVLEYVANQGFKVKKSKLYADIKSGLLIRQADGSFRKEDVDRYLATAKMQCPSVPAVDEAWQLQQEKDRQEIRRIKAVADKEEFALAIKRGEYIPKAQVYMELAGRAIVLLSGLKAAYEARISEIISKCHGDIKDAPALVGLLHEIQDMALDEYGRDIEFAVEFEDPE